MSATDAADPAAGTRNGLLLSIGLLTLIQAGLGQFLVHGIPLFLRDAGHTAQTIGLVYIASVPYVARFLWAPLIDRYGSPTIGHYRTWIIGGLGVCCLTLATLALTDPAASIYPILAIVIVMMIAIATQLTATGGLMVEYLPSGDRAAGASVQSAASGLAGMLLGFCVLYLLADLGWQATVSALVGIAVLWLCVLAFLRLDAGKGPSHDPARFLSQFSIMTRRDPLLLFGITVMVGIGLALTYGLKSIVLIDAGFSVAEAGLIGLVFGNLSGVVCALGMRPLVERYGGFRCLAALGVLAAAYCLLFSVLYGDGLDRNEATAFVIIANGMAFASFIASRSLLMGMCREGSRATEFATFISLEGVCILIFAGVGNMLSDQIGFSILLLVAAAGSLCGAVLAWSMRPGVAEARRNEC